MPKKLDVLAIGNAIVDLLTRVDEAFLERHGLVKNSMNLIDLNQATRLYEDMGPAVEVSGGSAANTAAGVAALGGSAAFIGKVADDQIGGIFGHDIRSTGVEFTTPPDLSGAATAHSFILITPDAQRTMNTYLGASQNLGPDDVSEDLVGRAGITYLEGYLWDPPKAKEAFLKAMNIAHGQGNRVALTLSDSFCVDRYRDEFLNLVKDHVDILFANEDEIVSLYQTVDFASALGHVESHAEIVVLTRSEAGSLILAGGDRIAVPAEKAVVEDTTGAGDLYASGFLAGLSRGLDLAVCGRMGSLSASEIISHVGARPKADLKAFVDQRLKD